MENPDNPEIEVVPGQEPAFPLEILIFKFQSNCGISLRLGFFRNGNLLFSPFLIADSTQIERFPAVKICQAEILIAPILDLAMAIEPNRVVKALHEYMVNQFDQNDETRGLRISGFFPKALARAIFQEFNRLNN